MGQSKYTTNVISDNEEVDIPMPEKVYKGKLKVYEGIWKRPRWPFEQRILRGDLECEEGIPHPGKGTCSYNCGDDATYGICAPINIKDDIIGEFVSGVLDKRRRYPL